MKENKYSYQELKNAFEAGLNCPIAGVTFKEYLECHNLNIINYDLSIFEKYKEEYDITLQLFGGQYIIYVDKPICNNVFTCNGYLPEEVVKKGFEYLEKTIK